MIKKLINSLWRRFQEWRNPLCVTLVFYTDKEFAASNIDSDGKSDGKHWVFLGAKWTRGAFRRKWKVEEKWEFSPGGWNKDLYPEL